LPLPEAVVPGWVPLLGAGVPPGFAAEAVGALPCVGFAVGALPCAGVAAAAVVDAAGIGISRTLGRLCAGAWIGRSGSACACTCGSG
jgi:hypothetical protein